MPTFVFGGWGMGVNLGQLLKRSKVHARILSSDLQHLGADASDRSAMVAQFVNESVEAMLDRLGSCGVSTAELTVTSGTQAVTLPATLRQRDVKLAQLKDSTDDYLDPLEFIDRVSASQMPPEAQDGTVTGVPTAFSFSEDGSELNLWPIPNAAFTLMLTFRPEITEIDADDVDSPDGVTLGEIPSRFERALAYRVGQLLCEELNQEQALLLERKYEAEMTRMVREFTRTMASIRSRESRNDGVINRRSFYRGLNLEA